MLAIMGSGFGFDTHLGFRLGAVYNLGFRLGTVRKERAGEKGERGGEKEGGRGQGIRVFSMRVEVPT